MLRISWRHSFSGLILLSGLLLKDLNGGHGLTLAQEANATADASQSSVESPAPINDVSTLPPAPTPAAQPRVIIISSPVPPYLDRGTTMVPLRPVADFLGLTISLHDRVLTITRKQPASELLVATTRLGGRTAQLVSNAATRTLALSQPVEMRMGNTFVPLRLLTEAFDVNASFRVPDNAIVLRTQLNIGVLTPENPQEYKLATAATVTITNNIGKAMSLRLNGPQKIALELGQGQSITRKVAPGVYYYKAASAGMRPRSGARRFYSSRKVTWAWGKR